MIAEKTKICGVYLLIPQIFEDHRGTYVQLYDSIEYGQLFPTIPQWYEFVQDDYSYSKKNVLRGIHGDYNTSKLITVVYGNVYAVIVDNRPTSPTYLQWQSFDISRENSYQLFIPAGCGNSMLALSDEVVYHYKQTTHYIPNSQFTLKWNDSRFNINWPISDPILSDRDL